MAAFSPDETRRYARHLVLKGIGGPGQQKLKAARVLLIGAGGLGSPVAVYLAAAGIGTLGIVDDDDVALSNLQRQILHGTEDVGTPKVESAQKFIARLNPHVAVETHNLHFGPDIDPTLAARYDVIVDGSDTIGTRAHVAAAVAAAGKPLVSGAVSMFDGQLTVFLPGPAQPGFRDLYPDLPDEADLPSCEATGVLGAVTGVIGTLMAMETIKLITGIGEPLSGRLLLYDGRAARFTELTYV